LTGCKELINFVSACLPNKCAINLTENAGRGNDGPSKSQGVKMQDMKMQDVKLLDTKIDDMKQ